MDQQHHQQRRSYNNTGRLQIHHKASRNGPFQGHNFNGPFQGHHNVSNVANENTRDVRQRTDDPKLYTAAKAIFQFIQLSHHLQNWASGMPKSIQSNINYVVDNVNPPLINNDFYQQLTDAGTHLASQIRQITTDFLTNQLQTIEDTLVNLDNSINLNHAAAIAASLSRRLRRLQPVDRDNHIMTALDIIKSSRCSRPVTPDNVAINPPTSGTYSSSYSLATISPNTAVATANAAATETNLKTSLSTKAPSTTQRPIVPDNSDAINYVKPAATSPQTRSPKKTEPTYTPKGGQSTVNHAQRPQFNYINAEVINHVSNTASATTTSTGTTTNDKPAIRSVQQLRLNELNHDKLIIVADGSIGKATTVPDNLEVVSLQRGRLEDLAKAVRHYQPHPTKRLRLAIQLGIHHRNDDENSLQELLFDLRDLLHDYGDVIEFYMAGVSHPSIFTNAQTENISKINDILQPGFKPGHYIDPLPSNDVEFQTISTCFTTSTANRIINAISQAF